MPSVRQTNFLGGELSPLLHGRTDLPVFGRGLRTMRNFFASRHGAAVSRPGTKFVHFAGGLGYGIRLIPFVYADDQSFCLEFGHQYVRFHTNGETLANGGAPVNSLTVGAGEPYTLLSPYSFQELQNIRWAQTGDVLTLTHPSYPALELRRTGNTNWGAVSYAGTVFREVVFARADPFFQTGYPVLKSPLPAATATTPAKRWKYFATLTVQDTATGLTFETARRPINESWDGVGGTPPVALASDLLVVGPDAPMTIWRKNGATDHLETGITPHIADNSYRELAMNIYRGDGELFGLVGSTDGNEFVDVGIEPDYAVQPPLSQNPFEVKDYAGVLQPSLKPAAVAFFQERRVFAVGGDLFFSATGDYTNFDRHVIQVAGEALRYQLASRKREETLNLVPLNKLLIHTKQAAWSIGGQQGEALDYDSVDARIEDEVGSVGVPPLVVNGIVYFARAKGVGVRALVPEGDGYRGVDVSVIAQHLFQGEDPDVPQFVKDQVVGQPVLTQRSIIDWTYAEDPWGLIWAVREDGVLLSFTPGAEPGSGAWARHDTQGYVRAICSVPEGGEDAVYVAVIRAVAGGAEVMCIERMTSRMTKGSPDDGACLDCSLRYKGAPVLTITGLDHLIGNSVYVVAKGNPPRGPLVVSPAGEVTLPALPRGNSDADGFYEDEGAEVVLYVGLNFTADLETLDVAQGEVRTKQKVTDFVGLEVDQSQGVKVGQDFDHLKPGMKRTPADDYNMPVVQTKLVRIPVEGAWGLTGRAALRQEAPLSVTVVGLVREVSIGD